MPKTVYVSRSSDTTYKVLVEAPSHSEQKAGGQFLDAPRLQTELQQHGCSAEQIEQGLNKLKEGQQDRINIVVD